MKRLNARLFGAALGAVVFASVISRAALVPAVERLADGVVLQTDNGLLKVQVCAENIVRVALSTERAFFAHPSRMLDPARKLGAEWKLTQEATTAVVTTSQLQVRIDRATGAVTFLDAGGRTVLAEENGGRVLEPADVQGVRTYHVGQRWAANAGESLYGLGEQHLGLADLKGYDLDLWQHNGTVVVPFLVSSRGYGILWDNESSTRFGDRRPFALLAGTSLRDADGRPGGLTGSYFADAHFGQLLGTRVDERIDFQGGRGRTNTAIHPDLPPRGAFSVRWEGSIVADSTGDHQLQAYSDGSIRLWIDDQLVADHWRQGWLPWYDLARVRLEAGRRHRVKLEWWNDDSPPVMQLRWKTPAPSPATALWSETGGGIDYYFVLGPSLDRVLAGYRQLTGPAPIMPRWAFGLWQSRQRYRTAGELLDVVKEFRTRRIPFDNIVLDWFYWKKEAWGSHEFDPARFPDPAGMVRTLHDELQARLMISVWPKFYPGTANFEAMQTRGFLYERTLKEGIRDWVGFPYAFYDAFRPEARTLFWEQVERELFRKNIDAWWLDATEPDLTRVPTLDGQREYMNPTAAGPGAFVLNSFALENAAAVHDGQRAAAPDRRVFILTRSGFAGLQRYAAANWSGDTSSTWTALRKQIPAALGFSLSGVPYWTMDVGGFSVPHRFAPVTGMNAEGDPVYAPPAPADAEDWRELNTRWFEFGAFTPLLRVHGEYPYREMWQFGGEEHPAYRAQLKFDRLRYRLLPYLYSVAGAVTRDGTTFMRPLVMDFADETAVRNVGDQYLFGPALLVSPVTEPRARSRALYLPATRGGWYDFWTGAAMAGGRTIDAPAPYDAIPVHVRAGAIVPFGPELQFTGEKPADPITLFVYAGADGAFTLYEDDGLTYGYERGQCARVTLRWDDAQQTLSIGERDGSFPGMLTERTFAIVRVSPTKQVGFSFLPIPDQTVRYTGQSMAVRLSP